MNQSEDTLVINAQIEVPVTTLTAIVENAKKAHGPDAKGVYRVDTAEAVNRIVTQFLAEKGFAEYASDPSHYTD